MDSAMRDLELIQERGEDESPGRKAAMLAMAGLSTVALVFAMGVMLGGGSDEQEHAGDDPLAALAPAMATEEPPAAPQEEPASESDTVETGEVRFHAQLTDDRPEVEAALVAAAAEQETLAAQGAAPTTPIAAAPAVAAAVAPSPAIAPEVPAHVAPAGDVARQPTENAVPHDVHPAATGREGAFTLQVVSYRTRAEADLFAEALRGRGHTAYVARVELPSRGIYFRVRIGPFESRIAADRYRARFEREENMNSYVVDTERAAANELAQSAAAD